MSAPNVFGEDWQPVNDWFGGGLRASRLAGGDTLGASLYELGPGNWTPLHFHHGSEELLVVLRGQPTLRTSASESRALREGEVVHFPRGPAGSHALVNETDAPARYLVAGTIVFPEIVEYPEYGQATAQAGTASQTGDPLFFIHDVVPD